MTLTIDSIIGALTDHAQQLGVFDSVSGHEAKVSPGSGVHCEIFGGNFELVPVRSGLATVTFRLPFRVRLRTNWLQQPSDDVDRRIIKALDPLMAAYCDNFTIGGLITAVDILGMTGSPVAGTFAYLDQGDGTKWRTLELELPLLVDDLWTEAP